jgi:acyl homoserine lactone synthase
LIKLIRGSERQQFANTIEQMHRLRKRVFHDRLGWDVKIHDGLEFDQFDDMDPLYIISEDDGGIVRGSLRLLPTTGPNMLADVFPVLLPPGESVKSPIIWETSRFSVDMDGTTLSQTRLIQKTTGELLCAMAEVGLLAGLEFFVAVTDLHIERILGIANCQCERLGVPVQVGKVQAVAGFWEVSDESLRRVRQKAGITGSVINVEDAERIALAA